VANPFVALVAGPSGWVQDLNFVVLGAAMIAFAIGLQLGVRPTRWAVLGPGLFAAPMVGPVQLVGAHPLAHLHGRPRPQTPACRHGGLSTVTSDDHRN
jgi:hypothetical protein